jgi:hypothetical protein
MISSNIHKLARSITAKRSIYYHRTDVKNLRRILKEGLLPAGYKGLKLKYNNEIETGGNRSVKTFGGVYLSKMPEIFFTEEGIIIIKVSIEAGSPGVLLDEDMIYDMFEDINFGNWRSVFPQLKNKVQYFNSEDPNSYQNVIDVLDTYDFSNIIKEFKKETSKFDSDWSRDTAKKDIALERVAKALVMHLLESLYEGNVEIHELKPESLKNTYEEWKESVTEFSKLFPKTTSKSDMNIRFPNPITYKGKNRILSISKLFNTMINDYTPLKVVQNFYGDSQLEYNIGNINSSSIMVCDQYKRVQKLNLAGRLSRYEDTTIQKLKDQGYTF